MDIRFEDENGEPLEWKDGSSVGWDDVAGVPGKGDEIELCREAEEISLVVLARSWYFPHRDSKPVVALFCKVIAKEQGP